MENNKDIGKAISDKLSSLDKNPSENVWNGINEALQKKKKRRTAFFFFWSKIACGVVLGLLAFLYYYHQNDGFNFILTNTTNETTTVNDSTANSDATNLKESTKENKAIKNNEINSINTAVAQDNAIENKSNINKNNNFKTNDDSKTIDFKSNKKGKGYTGSELNANPSNTKNGTALTKSGGKRNTKTAFSKSNKNTKTKDEQSETKSKLFAKEKSTKSTKNSQSNSQKESEASVTTQNINEKNAADAIDLNALKNKTANNSTADNKTKKTDSIAAKKDKDKDKDKTDTVLMEPKLKDSAVAYRKFYVDVFASPTYYNYFNKESTLDRRLDSLPKKAEIKFSYGIGLTYDLTRKISVRIGYTKLNLSYTTKNAPIGLNNPDGQYFTGIGYNPNISNESIYIASNGTSESMDITQKISYTEIPIEVKYKFLDKKLSLKSSLGFSYLLLNENSISIQTLNGYSQEIGKTNDLSKSAMSLNIGLEVEYPLFRNFSVFMEPMLNYQVKAFSNSTFKPYVLGVHTGIRFSLNNK